MLTQHYDGARQALTSAGADESLVGSRHSAAITTHVDSLSRMYSILVIEENSFEFNLLLYQSQDPAIKALRDELEKSESKFFELRNGLVYRKSGENLLFYVPASMEVNVLFKYHDEMGRVGVQKVYDLIKQSNWLPQLKEKVHNHIRNCLKCIAYSPTCGKIERKRHGEITTGPFDVIQIDHAGPMDKNLLIKKYVFLVIDAFTKFVKLYTTKITNSKEAIECLKQYFSYYSRPRTLVSDRGSAFTSVEFSEFLQESDVKHVKIATGLPQANGQAERVNRVLNVMLSKLTDNDAGKQCYKILNDEEFSINNVVHSATGEPSSKLIFGIDQIGTNVDEVRAFLKENVNVKERDLVNSRNKAMENMLKMQEYNKMYTDKRYKVVHKYNVGDWVMIRNFDSTAGVAH